jgi:hypothetical protein
MNKLFSLLALLVTFSLCSCKDTNAVATGEDGQRLNGAFNIATEINKEYGIKGEAYVKADKGIARIEFDGMTPGSELEGLAQKISTLKSARSFDGELHLYFRSEVPETGAIEVLAIFDAKTGKKIQQ